MKAIVHIGAPKTGTTTLQAFLHLNAEALRAQGVRFQRNVDGRASQFEYPMTAFVRTGTLLPHLEQRIRYKAQTLEQQEAEYAPFIDQLRRYRDTHPEPVALFSSEHIMSWIKRPELIESFHALMAECFDEVRYIVYYRKPDELIASAYCERVKRGGALSLDEYISRFLDMSNPYWKVKTWAETAGRENVSLRLLDKGFMVNGDLIADFCAACGLDHTVLKRPDRQNESLSSVATEALRVLNRRIPELRRDGRHNPLRRGILRVLTQIGSDAPRLRLNEKQRRQVGWKLNWVDKKLCEDFFPGRDTLWTPFDPEDEPMPVEELREQAMELMTELVIRLRLDRVPPLSDEEKALAVLRPHSAPLDSGAVEDGRDAAGDLDDMDLETELGDRPAAVAGDQAERQAS